MSGEPTYQDAMVLLKLQEVSALRGMPVPLAFLGSAEFDPSYQQFRRKFPPGTELFDKAMLIAQYFENLATLWKHGLLNEELLLDWVAVTPVWERIEGFVHGVREEFHDPRLGENFELLARAEAAELSLGVNGREHAPTPVA